MDDGMTKKEKAKRIIEHIIARARDGKDLELNLIEIPTVAASDAWPIIKGLTAEFSSYLSATFPKEEKEKEEKAAAWPLIFSVRPCITPDNGAMFVLPRPPFDICIHHPNVERLRELEKLVCGDSGGGLPTKENRYLRSISLVTASLEPSGVIFMVLDKNFHVPIRFAVKNAKGETTYVKKLYDIAYLANAPGKMVNYDRKLADGINNGLFRKRPVKRFMTTNKFPKPTLVQKSEDKRTLVLRNEVTVETLLIKNTPTQYQYLYTDKTG
jgi:hypothetical protein